MVRVLLLKLNGWPQWFDERIKAIAASVDEVVLLRPKPSQGTGQIAEIDNISTYNLYPCRGRFVTPRWLKPIIFPLHVLQAVLVMLYLYLRSQLPPVVHALDYALGGMAGSIIAHLCGVPLVVSVRGVKDSRFKMVPEEERTIRSSISYRILQLITRFVFSSADHIVTKAAYQVEFVKESYDVDAGFTTVPTGVDFELFNPSDESIHPVLPGRMEQQVDEDDEIVLYLSTFIPKKGPDQVLRLLNATDNDLSDTLKFVFIGEFRDASFENEFRTLMRNVNDRTILRAKPVPFEAVPGVLARADATILLSEAKTEGVPRILQESCTMQTPIIASNVAGIVDAFNDLPGCYLIDRNNPQEFKAAVEQATSNPSDMPREVFTERFDIHRNYAKYAAIYDELSRPNHL